MNYLSNKFNFERSQNELSILLESAKRKNSFIDLTSSNPTLFFEYDENLIQSALTENSFFPYTPDPQGLEKARLALVKYYKEKGRQMDAKNFFFTSGTSEAMSFILKAIANPESEILLPTPGYPLYDFILKLENCKAKNYFLLPQKKSMSNKLSWKIDFKKLEENITENTKAIVIVEPHNPTGSRLSPEDADNLVYIAKSKDLILIVDEVFSDYFENYYSKNPYEGANCIYLNGLSKTLALPQMKLSWIYLSGNSIFIEQMRDALEIVTDTYLSVNIPVQVGLERLLETADRVQKQIQTRIKLNSLHIIDLLKHQNGIDFFLPDGGWYMVLKLDEPWEEEEFTFRLLEDYGVYVYPGYLFDMTEGGYIVISLILSSKMIEEGMKRICALLSLDRF